MRIPLVGGGGASVQVSLDRIDVLPGDTVQATISVSGGKTDLRIQEGRLRLVLERKFTFQRHESGGRNPNFTVTDTTADQNVLAEQRFLDPGFVSADTPSEYTLSVKIPAEATPSGEGRTTAIRWKLEAALVRQHAPDVEGDVQLKVLSSGEAEVWPEKPLLDWNDECVLSFRLDRLKFGAGDSVAGTFVLTPKRDCHVDEVRVELVREEGLSVTETTGVEARQVLQGALELASGTPREFEFSLALPHDLCPTLKTDVSAVRWLLQGVFQRGGGRSDYHVTQELYVYSAPRQAT